MSNRASYRSTVERAEFRSGTGNDRKAVTQAPPPTLSAPFEGEDEILYQSSYDKEDRFWNRMAGALLLGFLATVVLFLALPFFQLISTVGQKDSGIFVVDTSKPPPPRPPVEKPPPPEKVDKKDEPELKQEQPKLTLSQLELALNPGMGDASGGGDFSMTFEVDAMEELEMIFELSEVDRVPQPIYRVAPVFPYEMKQAGISGSVSLLFVCDSQGRVKNIQIKSSTHREFEEPAIRALREWKFEPGIKDGQPVNVRMLLPFKFNVSD
jgi:protein TonB